VALRIGSVHLRNRCVGRTFSLQAEDHQNYLRSTMSQERLSGLAMLSIEIDICKHLSKNDVIDDLLQRQLGRCLSLRTSPLDNVRGVTSLNHRQRRSAALW